MREWLAGSVSPELSKVKTGAWPCEMDIAPPELVSPELAEHSALLAWRGGLQHDAAGDDGVFCGGCHGDGQQLWG